MFFDMVPKTWIGFCAMEVRNGNSETKCKILWASMHGPFEEIRYIFGS